MTSHDGSAVIALAGIYAIVDDASVERPVAFLEAILAGGIRLVQYRAKRGIDGDVLRAMLDRTRAAGAVLIVNDDLDAATLADGWHAGQEDLATSDLARARARLHGRIVGISCGTPEEAREAERCGADYIGVGPFAATGSKADAGEAIGAPGLRSVVAATRLPAAAIGGIDLAALPAVAATGAAMAAVISALARARDIRAAAIELVAGWETACERRGEGGGAGSTVLNSIVVK